MWIVQVLELADEGKPTGNFRLTATSDDGGGGPFGAIGHRHDSREEASACQHCREYVASITGMPLDKERPLKGLVVESDWLKARAAREGDAEIGAGSNSFQDRVKPWLLECFGPEIAADKLERGDRLLEELFELLQSGAYPRERIRAIENYVYSRPVGEPRQEAGGVMVTLAAYCLAHDIDMHAAGEVELARIWTKVEEIRAKQAAKPTGSALPIPVDDEGTSHP